MERKLLIDADVLVYEAAFGAQKTLYTYRGVTFKNYEDFKTFAQLNDLDIKAVRAASELSSHVEWLPAKVAKLQAGRKLAAIQQACDSDRFELLLSGTDNYRERFAVTKGYKANRASAPKPLHYEYVRTCLMEMGAQVVNGCEADDAIGIAMTEEPESVVCSIDKDLNMIPGRHYNWGTGAKYNVSEVDAQRWFMTQLLTGDSTDNIPGLPGIGKEKAKAILEPYRDSAHRMLGQVHAYYSGGPYQFKDGTITPEDTDAYLNEQGILLWIQRKADERWNLDYYQETYATK